MPPAEPPIDAALVQWTNVDPSLTNSGLLLGNGASRVIWDSFAYDSLYAKAQALPPGDMLTHNDIALFNTYSTTNFEGVLQSLATTHRVLEALGKPDASIMVQYTHIRQALVQSVHGTHIPHASVPPDTLQLIADELRRYEFVYSTTYDLLLYWSVMHVAAKDFKDFFWSGGACFDLLKSDAWGKPTKLLFIHGGLHIYIDAEGDTCKLTSGHMPILDQFANGTTIPVFISEGEFSDKLAAIHRSDYLSFAFSTLMQHSGPLVVFGQGLGGSDQHIVAAINRAGIDEIVIGIYPAGDDAIKAAKAHYRKCFPSSSLTFFDMSSHPMGSAALKVAP